MIAEHWVRPAPGGGLACQVRRAEGRTLHARARTLAELRALLEQTPSLLGREHSERRAQARS